MMTMTMTPQQGSTPDRLPPARRATLVLGTVFSLGFIAFTTVEIVGDLTDSTQQVAFTIAPTGSTLAVRTETGNLHIRRSADDSVHVTRTSTFAFSEPTYAEGDDGAGGNAGLLSGSCQDAWPGECEVSYDVAVPDGMSVVLQSDHGTVRVIDVTGPVDASSSSGDVEAIGLSGPVRLRSDHGQVTATGLRSDVVDAVSDSGDVTLRFADAPDTVGGASDHGTVCVLLPPGDAYFVDAATDVGDRTVTVDTQRTSERTITARSDTGDVEVLLAGADGERLPDPPR